MATLKINGDRIEPYEQGWVMRSAGPPVLVTGVLALDRCA
jgi:hypothetical protein